jgi:hypothetical protein
MLKTDSLLMIAASLLLLVVNWLAFHDFLERHTMPDWLMLLASILVFVQFGREFWNRNIARIRIEPPELPRDVAALFSCACVVMIG